MDVTQTLLFMNDGTTATALSPTLWEYVSNTTIRIDSQAYNINNTYTIQYTGIATHPAPIAQIVVEIRQGDTAAAVELAAWEVLPTYNTPVKSTINNLGVPSTYQFFQMRMSVFNITDIRFVRILSLLLKGIPVNWWGNKFINHAIDPGPVPPPPS